MGNNGTSAGPLGERVPLGDMLFRIEFTDRRQDPATMSYAEAKIRGEFLALTKHDSPIRAIAGTMVNDLMAELAKRGLK